MIEKLISLLGKSLETPEIKNLYAQFNAKLPASITCTANSDRIKGKVEKDGINLSFTRGGYSKYAKPIPAKRNGSYIGIFTMIEFTKKFKGEMPFGIKYGMSDAEITQILGAPKIVEFMGKTTTWRKNITDKHELVVSDSQTGSNPEVLRSAFISYIWEADLYTMEDYEKAGL